MPRPIVQTPAHVRRWRAGRNGRRIHVVVLHSTDIDGVALDRQYQWYIGRLAIAPAAHQEPKAPHFVVDLNGDTAQCVGLGNTAYHAGVSQWAPGGVGWMRDGRACIGPPPHLRPSVNCISLGIEMVHMDQRDAAWPDDQVRQVAYILGLLSLYTRQVPPGRVSFDILDWEAVDGSSGTVVSHESVARQAGILRPAAQGRDDPLGFPWRRLAQFYDEEWEQLRQQDPGIASRLLAD